MSVGRAVERIGESRHLFTRHFFGNFLYLTLRLNHEDERLEGVCGALKGGPHEPVPLAVGGAGVVVLGGEKVDDDALNVRDEP